MYFICGYSSEKFFISNPLIKDNILTFFDNKVFKNKIFTNNEFDLLIKLDNNDYNVFIISCKNKKTVYRFLSNKKNHKGTEDFNILNYFVIRYDKSYNNLNKIYFNLLREYPYKQIILNILINFIPIEIIFIIFEFLVTENIVSFNIKKSINNNCFYFSKPKIYF